jgi:hypothetical protein
MKSKIGRDFFELPKTQRKALPFVGSSFPINGRSLHTQTCPWGPGGVAPWPSNSGERKKRDGGKKGPLWVRFRLTGTNCDKKSNELLPWNPEKPSFDSGIHRWGKRFVKQWRGSCILPSQ